MGKIEIVNNPSTEKAVENINDIWMAALDNSDPEQLGKMFDSMYGSFLKQNNPIVKEEIRLNCLGIASRLAEKGDSDKMDKLLGVGKYSEGDALDA
jgi:hypothetical protein